MSEALKVVIIDDHPLFREGLKSILKRSSVYEVTGEAGTGAEGMRLSQELRPDVLVVDISLPDTSGIDLTRKLRTELPDSRVLVLSMHSRIDYIAEAFRAGATGYMVKESASDGFLRALDVVMTDEYFLDGAVSQEVIRKITTSREEAARVADNMYDVLTPREQEILRYLAEGLTAKEIAARLFISPKTVENHRSNIMSKLNLHSTIDLLRYATKLGLIDVDMWKE